MATGQTLVDRASRLLGLINSGESPTSAESADALIAINSMLDSWRNDRLMAYALQNETLTMAASQASYTIGPSGDLDTVRPVSIESAFMREGNIDYPVRVIDAEEFNSIPDKTSTSNLVQFVYYEGTMATGTLKVWPVPDTTNVLHLTTRVPFTALVLGTTVSLPPGWEEAIATNGAIAIAPEFQASPSPSVVKMANDSLKGIKRTNSKPVIAKSDFRLMFSSRRSNIESDQ